MKIPANLDTVLHRLTREMIRQQPKNIYEFAADFFDRLVDERDIGKSFQCHLFCILRLIILSRGERVSLMEL